jgi:hypothetical protein
MNILITCENCGKKVIKYIRPLRGSKIFFCSTKCRDDYKTTKIFHKERKICMKCRHFFDKKDMKKTVQGKMCKDCYETSYGKVKNANTTVS